MRLHAYWQQLQQPTSRSVLTGPNELLLTGHGFTAEEAAEWGFVSKLVKVRDLPKESMAFAAGLAEERAVRGVQRGEVRERCAEVDGLIAVSQTYGDLMRERLQVPAERLHTVHNGIEIDDLQGELRPACERDPKTIGFLARMCHDKGLDTLVDAFLLLKQRGSIDGLRLRIAGVQLPEDRAYVADLQARIAEQGRQNDVEFLPNIDRQDKVAFLQTLSVLSVPARYNESFGLYLLEAMAAGVPVVQPRHAAFPEILEATGGGLLCEPDSASSLADTLLEALTNDTLAQELGAQARRSIKSKFTAEHMAQRVATICEKLAAPGAAKAPRNIAH